MATVSEVQYHGHDAVVRLRVEGVAGPALLARIPGDLRLKPGAIDREVAIEWRGG